jgi:hypothetical protein|tara:strand:- start:5976 stop:6449 length:474 start_codon:yes stop_codon:yes gene_type:complete
MTDKDQDKDLKITNPEVIKLDEPTHTSADLINNVVESGDVHLTAVNTTSLQQPKNKGGRPKVKVDTKIIENMASIHCTNKEIAEVLSISVDTLQRNFPDILQKGRANGKAKLRRLQWQKAEEGNPTMLIWLGKQMLDQKEQPISTEDNQPLPWTDNE